MPTCNVCFRHCEIPEGGLGFCGARTCDGGNVTTANYGRLTALALDPIEKKPLRLFHPGSMILSVGSYGCNLRCPFCQNSEISWSEHAMAMAAQGLASPHSPGTRGTKLCSPEELADIAHSLRPKGNIGIAFTYNEPLVGYEYVRDAARLAHERGLATVMVTNGTATREVLAELVPYIDAMNIDLKGFTEKYYRDVLGGDLEMVKAFIQEAARHCHVELTTLIVPGENDSEEEMRALCQWVAGLECGGKPARTAAGGVAAPAGGDAATANSDRAIPLHISRFFPRFHMTDRDATDVGQIYRLADVAGEYLEYVYPGNVW